MSVYAALDTTFTLEAPRRLRSVLRDAYVDLVAPSNASAAHAVRVDRSVTGSWRTLVDGEVRRRGMDASAALLEVRRAINDLAEQSALSTDVVLNASAIGIGDTAVGIVGPVLAGKSSLLLTAARRGHGYIADDVLAVRTDGFARPFHRPVGIRMEAATELGVSIPRGPFRDGYPLAMSHDYRLSTGAPLGLLVIARRGDDLRTELRTPSWGLMLLASTALRAPGHERAMFHRLGMLLGRVPVLSLWFDRSDDALDAIESTLAAPRPL